MKIGFDSKRYFHNSTGLGNYSRTLVNVLARFYPENELFLFNPKPKKNKYTLPENLTNVREINPTKTIDKLFPALWRQKNCVKDIESNAIDIYHGLSGEIPIGLNSEKVKSVVTIHDLIFMRFPNLYSFADRTIHYQKFKYAAENATQIVAITKQTKEDIVTFLGVPKEKIKVIYQGCNAVFRNEFPSAELLNTQKQFNLPEKFILNVGTIEKRKNLELIVKSIVNTDIFLVVIGKKTAYFKEIESLIAQYNLQKQIIFLQNVSLKQLAQIYQLATIFVYPSIFEGFGIPIIEALYSKTPVISSTGGCFQEAGGPNSIYVDSDDVDAMKNALLSLWNDDQKRIKMAKSGFDFVQKFNDDNIANEWIAVYKSLI